MHTEIIMGKKNTLTMSKDQKVYKQKHVRFLKM